MVPPVLRGEGPRLGRGGRPDQLRREHGVSRVPGDLQGVDVGLRGRHRRVSRAVRGAVAEPGAWVRGDRDVAPDLARVRRRAEVPARGVFVRGVAGGQDERLARVLAQA